MTPEIKKMASFTAIGYCLAPPDGDFAVLDASAYWLDTSSYALTHEGILFEYYMGKDTLIYVPVIKK